MQKLLINLLAETDSLFEPIRDWRNPPGVIAIIERRAEFHSLGLPIPKSGGDANERQRFTRWLDTVENSGQVAFHRRNGKRAFWKLANAADWKLRSTCTGWRFADCLSALLILRELADAGCTNGKSVPDWHIADVTADKNADRIFDLEAILAPALCRNWVTAWSDYRGRNGYRLTDCGCEFLNQPLKPPAESDFESALGDQYLKVCAEARKNLRTLKPRHESALPIPLSAGDWPGPNCRKHIPSIFDRRGKVRTPAAMTRAILKNTESKK